MKCRLRNGYYQKIIEDILPEQAYWLEKKRKKVIETFLSYGYGLVIPPLIEINDSLLSNASDDLDLQTFKLIDQETGKQLGLRADITSQISRIYSTYCNPNEINHWNRWVQEEYKCPPFKRMKIGTVGAELRLQIMI